MKTIVGALALGAFLATPLMAADMPVKAPPPVAAPVFSWTGCYVGVHGGYGWGNKKWDLAGVEITDHDTDGWLVGGQLGCQLQQDRWVFGIEGQASWADIDGDSAGTGATFFSYHTKTDVLGTIALRLGYAVDRTLFYVKGGAAFAHDHHWIDLHVPPTPTVLFRDSDKYLRWGWMVGGGIEYAFTGNWSGKIEYNYMHLGREDVDLCLVPVSTCDIYSIKQNLHVVKAGINYRFGPSAVVARY